MDLFLAACVAVPILCGVGLLITGKKMSMKAQNLTFVGFLALGLVLTLTALYGSTSGLRLWSMTEKIYVEFAADPVSKLFGTLMSVMFLLAGIYATDYTAHDTERSRFFGCFLMVMGVLNGIYLSTNLVSMYLFYELMTLLSLPLVLHDMTKEAISAGLKYLFYSIAGAFLTLISIFMIYQYAETFGFKSGGVLSAVKTAGHENALLVFAFLAIVGFGCKAGLFPLQDWLPTAHPVAPAPASAILSGIITKSGVVAIIRLIFYSLGIDFIKGTWVQTAFIVLSLVTVFIGSMMAFLEKGIKKRFAYSTVSQVSYVLFGLATLNPVAVCGSLLHIVFHSCIKDDLFLVAGSIIHNTGAVRTDELKGIGKRMPLTIGAFTLSALALVGIPPFSGFVSKWYLCTGALDAGIGGLGFAGCAVLLISALLTAGYLFPITIDGFFPGADYAAQEKDTVKCEPKTAALIPIIILGVMALIMGIFPGPLTEAFARIAADMGL